MSYTRSHFYLLSAQCSLGNARHELPPSTTPRHAQLDRQIHVAQSI